MGKIGVMTVSNEFVQAKENARVSLQIAIKNKEVDAEILPVLDLINQFDEYYTSSSCAGRIVLLELPQIGDKKNAKFLGKWHRNIESNELISSIKKAKKGQLWFLAQSPIIHVVAKTNNDAENILKIGKELFRQVVLNFNVKVK